MADKANIIGKKTGKLKNKEQFDDVLHFRKKVSFEHFALHFKLFDLSTEREDNKKPDVHNLVTEGLYLGMIIPKRWAKSAARRSLIKRQCRAQFMLFSHVLPYGNYVVRLKYGFDASLWSSASSNALKVKIREELQHLFSQIKS